MSCGLNETSARTMENAWCLDWSWLKWYFVFWIIVFLIVILVTVKYQDWKQRKENEKS